MTNTYPSKERRERVYRAKLAPKLIILAFIVVLGAWFLESQFLKVEAAGVSPVNSFLENPQVQKDLSSYQQQEEAVREICQGYL